MEDVKDAKRQNIIGEKMVGIIQFNFMEHTRFDSWSFILHNDIQTQIDYKKILELKQMTFTYNIVLSQIYFNLLSTYYTKFYIFV